MLFAENDLEFSTHCVNFDTELASLIIFYLLTRLWLALAGFSTTWGLYNHVTSVEPI